jgi:hypothetical protein
MCQARQARQPNGGMTKITVEEAVGTRLAHDITEIRPGEFKGPSFRRGHKVQEQDVCRLMRLGKRHLYVLDLNADQVHEDDAVVELATALAGPGITFGREPSEGKLQLAAAYTGLLKINTDALVDFNLIPDVMCAAMHNNVPVSPGSDRGRHPGHPACDRTADAGPGGGIGGRAGTYFQCQVLSLQKGPPAGHG